MYDPKSGSLLLSCKNAGKKKNRDELLFYRYTPGGDGDITEFSVPQRTYDTVQEGLTRVRALSGWQTREPVRFEVLA